MTTYRKKTSWTVPLLTTALFLISQIFIGGCGGGGGDTSSTPAPTVCDSVPGIAYVNIGSTSGGTWLGAIGTASIQFDNTNLNFTIVPAIVSPITVYLADLGEVCLSTITTWPASGQPTVAMIENHRYVVEVDDGTHYKFSVNSYSNGVAHIGWVKM